MIVTLALTDLAFSLDSVAAAVAAAPLAARVPTAVEIPEKKPEERMASACGTGAVVLSCPPKT